MQPDANHFLDFETLIRQHQTQVWQYLRYLGASDASEADDLTQETFLALLGAIRKKSFEERGTAATAGYLRKIARNQLLQLRRRRGKELDTVQLEVAEQVWSHTINRNGRESASDQDGVETFLQELARCREKLEGRVRQVVDWFYQEGLSRDAIASRLDMKPQGIKTLLRRTRQSLRECVERGINR